MPGPCTPSSPASDCAWGCAAALTYLAKYAAPLFSIHICGPGAVNDDGSPAQAMTCALWVGPHGTGCPGVFEIVISDPCSAAYRNEAQNSQLSAAARRIVAPDNYGHC